MSVWNEPWQPVAGQLFKQEWLNECVRPIDELGDDYYWRLAWEYHVLTESHDQRVCRERRKHIAIPRSIAELCDVNRYAKQVLADIARREGIDLRGEYGSRLRRAIHDAARPFERWWEKQHEEKQSGNELAGRAVPWRRLPVRLDQHR
jgi:hypothetical protein